MIRRSLSLVCVLVCLFAFVREVSAMSNEVSSSALTRRVLADGGVTIHHRVWGDPARSDRPLLVLVHGWSCDLGYWDAQIDALAADYSLVAIDLAGHGRSGSSREDFSMGAFGRDVAAVVRSLPGQAPVVLIGHSMGGPVAAEAARELGSRVRAVIGVDTFKNVGKAPPPTAETEARLAFFQRDFAGSTRLFVTQTFFKAGTDPAFIERIAADMAAGDARVGVAAIRELNAWDGVRTMAALNIPVIAINADHGEPTDETRLRALVPTFRARVLAGVGHFLMMEDPARFNAALRAELETIR